MKIAVYGIAKNEEKFAEGWARCAQDADYRFVLDTGSTDRTREILAREGVVVGDAVVTPWRFDVARNLSLDRLPSDIDVCVSLDLDERLMPGWREAVERAWVPGTTLLRYLTVQKWRREGEPELMIYGHKIHARHRYEWKYAIHEILRPLTADHVEAVSHDLWVNQFQDEERDRTFYFEMLNRLVVEEPEESRYSYYRMLELGIRGEYEEAIVEGERYLAMPSVYDLSERAFVLRSLGWAKKLAGRPSDEVVTTFLRAAAESPQEREPWVSLAVEMGREGNWPNAFAAAVNALRVSTSARSFRIEPFAWDGTPESIFFDSGRKLGIPEEKLVEIFEQVNPPSRLVFNPLRSLAAHA